jgi:hypothetical protein
LKRVEKGTGRTVDPKGRGQADQKLQRGGVVGKHRRRMCNVRTLLGPRQKEFTKGQGADTCSTFPRGVAPVGNLFAASLGNHSIVNRRMLVHETDRRMLVHFHAPERCW